MCPHCQSTCTRKNGYSPTTFLRRYRCNDCKKSWSDGDIPRGGQSIGDVPMTDAERAFNYRRRLKNLEKIIDLDT